MVEMSVLIGLVVLVVIITVAAWVIHRRGGDEVHSIQGYRHTLETLQEIGSRSARGGFGVVDEGARLSTSSPSVSVSRTGDSPRVDHQDDQSPAAQLLSQPHGSLDTPPGGIVFTDPSVAALDRHAPDDPGLSSDTPGDSSSRSRRGRDRAMSAMNRGPNRLGIVSVVGVVVVVLVVALTVASVTSKTSSKKTANRTRASTNSTKSSSAPTNSHSSRSRGHRRRRSSTTTSTTAPPSLTATTWTATTATYLAPASSYTLTVAATTGRCWVNVTSSSGAVLLSATLPPGQKQSLPVSGVVTVILGAPSSVAVSLNSEAVTLPVGFQTPFTMTLQPPSSVG
jgi:hypothetical protein